MYLREFLSKAMIIELNHETGEWKIVRKKHPAGDVPRSEQDQIMEDISGLFYVYEGIYMFCYWTLPPEDGGKFLFRSSEGAAIEIDGRNYAECIPATDSAGNPQPGFNQFSIYKEDSQLLYRQIYDASFFTEIWLHDCMYNWHPDGNEKLEEFDWFLSILSSFAYMKEKRLEREAVEKSTLPHQKLDTEFTGDKAHAGDPCPHSGNWQAPHLLGQIVWVNAGDVMPGEKVTAAGNAVIWYLRKPQ